MSESSRLMNASAVMAAGTAVSRLSGYVRSVLLIAALGGLLHADLFTIANTLPNMVYILLAGGVFNAVLVPQLVRAQAGEDGGAAYTNRVITLAALFLGGVTIVLVAVARGSSGSTSTRPTSTPTGRPTSPRSSTSPAGACRRSSSTACSCWSARCSTRAAPSAR